jgi:hypothetical protein
MKGDNTEVHVISRAALLRFDEWAEGMIVSQHHPRSVNFSSSVRDQIVSPFVLPPQPEVVYYQVYGPGSPAGLWSFTRNQVYLFFSTAFLDMSTFHLLSPSWSTIRIPLFPAECPGLRDSPSISTLLPVHLQMTKVGLI